MIRKIIYIALVLFAFHILAGFNIARIPQWFKGIWEYNSGKFISAIGSFEKAQDGDSDAVMQYNKGAAKYRDSDFKAAEEDFTKASETNPQFEPAYYNQGNARVKQGKLKEAVESYEKALEIDPDDEDARHNLEYVKKLLEQKNNTGDNADSQSDQQRQNPQASDKEGQSTKDKGSEELKGKEQQEKKNSDQKGEASG